MRNPVQRDSVVFVICVEYGVSIVQFELLDQLRQSGQQKYILRSGILASCAAVSDRDGLLMTTKNSSAKSPFFSDLSTSALSAGGAMLDGVPTKLRIMRLQELKKDAVISYSVFS